MWFSDDCAERDQNLILFHSRSISNHKMQWRYFRWSRKKQKDLDRCWVEIQPNLTQKFRLGMKNQYLCENLWAGKNVVITKRRRRQRRLNCVQSTLRQLDGHSLWQQTIAGDGGNTLLHEAARAFQWEHSGREQNQMASNFHLKWNKIQIIACWHLSCCFYFHFLWDGLHGYLMITIIDVVIVISSFYQHRTSPRLEFDSIFEIQKSNLTQSGRALYRNRENLTFTTISA